MPFPIVVVPSEGPICGYRDEWNSCPSRVNNSLLIAYSSVLDFSVFSLGARMTIQRMGVVGAGTMGNGIAHVFARAGYEVVLCDIEQKFLDRALTTIGKNIDREVAKNNFRSPESRGPRPYFPRR